MFCAKKIAAREGGGKDTAVDFPWLYYTAMAKLGFTRREAGWLYFGEWSDLYQCHMRQHNFEVRRGLYQVQDGPGEVRGASLDDM